MKAPQKVLVIRLSALGDVAMVIPVLYPVCNSFPQTEFVMLTSPMAGELFINRPSNLEVITIDTKKEYKGLKGVFAVYKRLSKLNFDAVADLHSVIRSKILSLLFSFKGVKTASIDKGRKEKRAITAENKKEFKQLKTSFERYGDVFSQLGMTTTKTFLPFDSPVELPDYLKRKDDDKRFWIGVAPISKHPGKNYSVEKMKSVIDQLVNRGKYRVFIFGSPADGEIFDKWQTEDGSVVSLCSHKLGFKKEMSLIKHLSLMLSMDSANMHIASLMGTPTISIWGATHSYTGFLGWGLSNQTVIERTDLDCRPCSVFGNKPCKTGGYACLDIPASVVVKKIVMQTEGAKL